jgi:hypothetical protein
MPKLPSVLYVPLSKAIRTGAVSALSEDFIEIENGICSMVQKDNRNIFLIMCKTLPNIF